MDTEDAALSKLVTYESVELSRSLPPEQWRFSPFLKVVGPALVWAMVPLENFKTARSGSGLLEGFLKLADAPDEGILRFARKFGPLKICNHVNNLQILLKSD